jgi:hypothetical protein
LTTPHPLLSFPRRKLTDDNLNSLLSESVCISVVTHALAAESLCGALGVPALLPAAELDAAGACSQGLALLGGAAGNTQAAVLGTLTPNCSK